MTELTREQTDRARRRFGDLTQSQIELVLEGLALVADARRTYPMDTRPYRAKALAEFLTL